MPSKIALRVNKVMEAIQSLPIWGEWKKRDWFLYWLFIPAILFSIYYLVIIDYLPENILTLKSDDPTIVSIFFSNYTHNDIRHLIQNILGYWLMLFFIFNIEEKGRFFYLASSLNFILAPFIISLIVVHAFPINFPPSLGFSGISYAFFGYLLYSFYNWIKKKCYPELNYSFIFSFIFLNILIFLILSIIFIPNTSLLLFLLMRFLCYDLRLFILLLMLLLVTLFLIYVNMRPVKEVFTKLFYKAKSNKNLNILIMGYIMVVIFMLMNLFWLILVIDEQSMSTNTLAHLVGYLFGVIMPILTENVSKPFRIYTGV